MPVPPTSISAATITSHAMPMEMRMPVRMVGAAAGRMTVKARRNVPTSSVRREWINVARTLEVGTVRRAFTVILPAAAPTILTGMRISIGIAWLVIVAAEMLVGGTGIGYFVWNEWNNLSITNVIIAILLIGVVGMLLDQILAHFTRMVTFPE